MCRCVYAYLRRVSYMCLLLLYLSFFFFQAEDGIRDLVRSRGLGDVYKRQRSPKRLAAKLRFLPASGIVHPIGYTRSAHEIGHNLWSCLLYTSDAADERSSVDLGGRRIIKKKKTRQKQCKWQLKAINTDEHFNKHHD